MTHTIGVGVIGMGWMGEAHSRSYLHVPLHFPQGGVKSRLVICADNVAERAAQAQAVLGFEANTTDWRQVIEHPEVELVIVNTSFAKNRLVEPRQKQPKLPKSSVPPTS